MRTSHVLILSIGIVLAAGCAGRIEAQPVAPDAPAAPAVSSGYRLGQPVTSQVEAVTAAVRGMEDPSFKWTEPPRTVLVEQMTYEEAMRRRWGVEPGAEQFIVNPRDTSVWLVIVYGRWTLKPMGPQDAAPLPYEGCLFRILAARDGGVIAAGDAICPGKG